MHTDCFPCMMEHSGIEYLSVGEIFRTSQVASQQTCATVKTEPQSIAVTALKVACLHTHKKNIYINKAAHQQCTETFSGAKGTTTGRYITLCSIFFTSLHFQDCTLFTKPFSLTSHLLRGCETDWFSLSISMISLLLPLPIRNCHAVQLDLSSSKSQSVRLTMMKHTTFFSDCWIFLCVWKETRWMFTELLLTTGGYSQKWKLHWIVLHWTFAT